MFYYSVIGLLAAAILLIENHDILFGSADNQKIPAMGIYKKFLYAVLVYYITDVLWGVLDSLHLIPLLFADTLVYFTAMASGILLWTQYVATYLDERNTFSRFLVYVGRIFFAVALVLIVINGFTPMLFYFDEDGLYHACFARYALLQFQVLLFLLTAIYAFHSMMRTQGTLRKRYRTICLFGLAMAVLLFVQLDNPYLPIYSVGYMLGTCLLHTFVVNDEKEEYRQKLLDSLRREKMQHEELRSAWQLAHRDALTGVRSKQAYADMEERTDMLIASRSAPQFAVAVFDLNGLKSINDRMGQETGDRYLVRAAHLICGHFKQSSVFRIGGDEFAALLEGMDFRNRSELKDSFDRIMEEVNPEEEAVVAAGMADFIEGQDTTLRQVFERAGQQLHLRKRELKRQADAKAKD